MRHWPLSDIVVSGAIMAVVFVYLWRNGAPWRSRIPMMSWRSAVIAGLLSGVACGVVAWFAVPGKH